MPDPYGYQHRTAAAQAAMAYTYPVKQEEQDQDYYVRSTPDDQHHQPQQQYHLVSVSPGLNPGMAYNNPYSVPRSASLSHRHGSVDNTAYDNDQQYFDYRPQKHYHHGSEHSHPYYTAAARHHMVAAAAGGISYPLRPASVSPTEMYSSAHQQQEQPSPPPESVYSAYGSEPPSPIADQFSPSTQTPSPVTPTHPIPQMQPGIRVIRTRNGQPGHPNIVNNNYHPQHQHPQHSHHHHHPSSGCAARPIPFRSPSATLSSTANRANSTAPPPSAASSGNIVKPVSPSQVTDRYPCEHCGKSFSRSHDRKRHCETHHNPNPPIHRCEGCGREFGRSDSLKRHIEHGACHKRTVPRKVL